MNCAILSKTPQCGEAEEVVLARVILEESLIPAVGGVGLLGNTLTIIVLNRCHEFIFNFAVVFQHNLCKLIPNSKAIST